MKRNLKALGLALCAAFALSVVSASAASAVTHHVDAPKNTVLSATSSGSQTFYATTDDLTKFITCEHVNVSGTTSADTETNTSITVEPEYVGCGATLGESKFTANVTENGCHYTFTGETTATETEGEHATVHLGDCEGEKGITVDVTFLNLQCIHVPEQTLHGIKYVQDGNDITVDATVHGIHSTTTGACEEENPEENTHNDGVYLGHVVVGGTGPLKLTTT